MSPALLWVQRVPVVLFLYPTLAGFTLSSMNVFLLGLAMFYALSVFSRVNQGFRLLPGVEIVWALARGAIVVSAAVIGLRLHRMGRPRSAISAVIAAEFLAIIPILDQRLRNGGRGRSVHALGMPGAGPDGYVKLLELTESAQIFDRIFLAFYPNDLGFSSYHDPVRLFLLYHLDNCSPGLQVLRKIAASRFSAWDVNSFHKMLVGNFAPSDATYPSRWAELRRQLESFRRLAAFRSPKRPVFLILPIMEDFSTYPLSAAHDELAGLARSIGFDPIDMLPRFREAKVDPIKHRASPNDNHYADYGHRVVADAILDSLGSAPGK